MYGHAPFFDSVCIYRFLEYFRALKKVTLFACRHESSQNSFDGRHQYAFDILLFDFNILSITLWQRKND